MKKYNDKSKKWLIVFTGLIFSMILIGLIDSQFRKEPVADVTIPENEVEVAEVSVDKPILTEKEDEIVVEPILVSEQVEGEAKLETENIDVGTEQKIQADISEKPTYTEEQLSDPTQKPNGEKVEQPKEEMEEDNMIVPQQSNTETQPKPQSSGGLPGFENVPEGGNNHVIEAEDMYENGNKIGDMN
jgi:outer membrane biosynthesis protein TonB